MSASVARPVPGPVYPSPEFVAAIARGTRTRSGRPGATYWVQHARYSIDAQLDPATDRVTGHERVVYLNNSPDTLRRLAIHLRQNAFAAGNPRRQAAPITGGVSLERVVANGRVIPPRPVSNTAVPITDVANQRLTDEGGYTIDGTVMWLPLAAPLVPHDSVSLELAWSYVPPESPSDGRQGREGHHLYLMGYWYPQIAVYDDVHGWVADPYLLEAEFYMDQADYDVRLTVPRGWVVGATGSLVNPDDILSAATRAKLADARRTGAVVHIVEPGASFESGAAGAVTWHFVAPAVRDFAWGTSDQYFWDATRALVRDSADRTVDTVNIYSFYRQSPAASAWALGGARFTRDAVEQHSRYLWPYPWATMTSMEGVLDSGGMEYPMMTYMQPWADTLSLAGDLMHETGHMWFPMQVGSNETRHPWMDEGFTQYDVAQGMRQLYGEPRSGGRPGDSEQGQRMLYVDAARSGHDMTLMWPGDLYPEDWYFIMYYDKTAAVLAALRGLLGEETFHRAYREYGRRWIGKHPYPYDFFNTMSDVAGRNLDWFWTTWFYEPWPLDQAIASVETQGDSTAITIEDRGLAPMPVELAITRASGATQRVTLPVDIWLAGARRYVVRVAASPTITGVVIDPDNLFPDIDRDNQGWRK
ncbi:MAG TPA: M1 family metallopeptidase [Gemmatimonadaceae bacterium]|nr:M1 family metallopeptidase [Gemmatimonadaceae bacterium]